jgi:hypothetical protein
MYKFDKDNLPPDLKVHVRVGYRKVAGPFEGPVTCDTNLGIKTIEEGTVYVPVDNNGYPYPISEEDYVNGYHLPPYHRHIK